MIPLSEVLRIAKKGEEFSIKFIAHGNSKRDRKGGYEVAMSRAICTSTYSERRSMNIKSLDSEQTREAKWSLIIEFNGKEVML